jgi:hypothetical protein
MVLTNMRETAEQYLNKKVKSELPILLYLEFPLIEYMQPRRHHRPRLFQRCSMMRSQGCWRNCWSSRGTGGYRPDSSGTGILSRSHRLVCHRSLQSQRGIFDIFILKMQAGMFQVTISILIVLRGHLSS